MSEKVLFEELESQNGFRIGVITLNSEKTLNAIDVPMIALLRERLGIWSEDPNLACVMLRGAGEKAFCAGGDVLRLHQSMKESSGLNNPYAQEFFETEYRLDYLIHTYDKPVIVWGTGIVMGGGLGLFAGASHRLVTETSRIAMPEITIGLYPDVGGSWFLNRMPGKIGLYLGLTGAPVNASDACFLGLAGYRLSSSKYEEFLDSLKATTWSEIVRHNRALVSLAIRPLALASAHEMPLSNVKAHQEFIQEQMDFDSLLQIRDSFSKVETEEKWIRRGMDSFLSGSPTSAYLIYEVLHRSKHLSLKEAFMQELVLSMQCAAHPDFAEGVRALLIDKDNTPKWTPAALEEVSDEWIEGHFASPWSADEHPLCDL